MDRVQEMALFATLAEQSSFAGAARHHGLSTATVTRAIASLEQRLGVLLVVRTTRSMRLTDAGLRFANDCRRLLAELNEAESAAAGLHTLPSGLLTVTAPQMFGALHVTPVLTRFLSQYPDVEIRAILVDRVVPMLDEGIDVAIRIGALPDSSLTAIGVGSVRRMVCASPGYLKQYGTPEHPDELVRHATISTSAFDTPPKWPFRIGRNEVLVDVGARLSLTSFQGAISAALEGWGLTQVPYYQIREHLLSARLACVLEDFEIEPEAVHVVYLEGRRGSSKVRSFVDFCVAGLRADLDPAHRPPSRKTAAQSASTRG